MPVLAPNSLIVITGVSGYIASHVGVEAIKAGHRVRGTVRNLDKAESLKAAYVKEGVDVSKLEFVTIDDLTSEAQYLKAFEGADGVAHVALPGPSPKWVEETTESVLSVLRAAAKTPSIKRVVLTSSSVTVISPPDFVDRPLTNEDWNWNAVNKFKNATAEQKADPAFTRTLYASAKTISEQEGWKWLEENKPSFELVSILPNANFGPILHGEPRSTANWIIKLLKNEEADIAKIPPQWYIDVRDDARLHVLGFTTPELGNKRVWAAAGPYGWNDLLAILHKNFPSVKIAESVEGGVTSEQVIDSEPARKLLGGWIPLEKAVVDTAKSQGY